MHSVEPVQSGINFESPAAFNFVLAEHNNEIRFHARSFQVSGAVGSYIFDDIVNDPKNNKDKLPGLQYDSLINGHDFASQSYIPVTGTIVGVGYGYLIGKKLYLASASHAVESDPKFSHLNPMGEDEIYSLDRNILHNALEGMGFEWELVEELVEEL